MTQHTMNPVSLGSAVHDDTPRTPSLRRLLLALGLVACAVLVAREAWGDILRIVQRDEEASHILLVPPVFAWLLWTYRERLMDSRVSGTAWGLAIVAAGWAFWAFGYIRGMQVFWHFGAILLMVGAFTSVIGVRVLRDAWPAFLVLLFLLPVPGIVRQPVALLLQNASAQLTQHTMMLLGEDVERSGNVLMINGQEIGIAEACNGMRMVTMLVLVCYTFVFVHPLRLWVRLLLIAIAPPLAILGNLVRLVPTVYAYGYSSQSFADSVHTWLGWVMVVLAYFMLMGVVALMRWLLIPVTTDQTTVGGDHRTKSKRDSASSVAPLWLTVTLCVLLLVGVAVHGYSFPSGQTAVPYHMAVRHAALDLPREIGPWVAVDTEVPEAAVALLRPNVLISRRYRNERTGRSFEFLLVQCADARDMEGHFPPVCYPAFGWDQVSAEPLPLGNDDFRALATSYRFRRQSTGGRQYGVWVTNIILLPQGRFARDMRDIRRLAGTYSDRFFGAAQVQLVFDERWTETERREVADQVVLAMRPVMEMILAGPDLIADQNEKPE